MPDSPHTADMVFERPEAQIVIQHGDTMTIDMLDGRGPQSVKCGDVVQLRNPDGPEAAAEIKALREALEPFTRGPDGTSLAKLYAHLNREHYHKALAALKDHRKVRT